MDLSTLAPGELRRVPNTALRDARQADGRKVIEWLSDPVTGADQPWPVDAGTVRERSIMLAESGAAVDIEAREIYVCGGGHRDGAHFGVYGLKYRAPGDAVAPEQWKWRRAIRHPQLYNGANNYPHIDALPSNRVGINPDGSPVSRHTWGGILFVPERKRLWIALGSIWASGWGDPLSASWLGDCVAGKWERGHQMQPAVTEAIVGAARDGNKVIWTVAGEIREHNIDSGQNRRLNGPGDPISTMGQCVLDEHDRKLYLTLSYGAEKYLRVFNVDVPGSVSQQLQPTGDLTALETYRVGQWWSSRYGLVQWIGGNELYIAKLPETHFEKHTLTGDAGPARVIQGMFGKFCKLTADGEYFAILTEVMTDVYVGRMPTIGANMATPDTVLAKTYDAANEASALAGKPSMPEQIADLQAALAAEQAKNATLTAEKAALQKTVDDFVAAEESADAAEAARLAALKQNT